MNITKIQIALLAAGLAVLPLLAEAQQQQPAFRITRKIYGYQRYEGDEANKPAVKTQQPAPEPAKTEPQPTAETVTPKVEPPVEKTVEKPVEKPVEQAPVQAKQEEKPAEKIKLVQPLPPTAEPNLPQPDLKSTTPEPQPQPQVQVQTGDEPTVRVVRPTKGASSSVVKEPDWGSNAHINTGANVNVKLDTRIQGEPLDDVVVPKTDAVDFNNQPPHVATFAEKAETLKPAKNEALFKEALKHYNEATKLGQQGKFKEAVVAYQKALYIHPAFPDARVGLAVSYASLGQWLPMINELEMALQLKDMFLDQFNIVQAHYNLGAAYCVQGNAKRAQNELNEVKTAKHPNIKQLEMFMENHCSVAR